MLWSELPFPSTGVASVAEKTGELSRREFTSGGSYCLTLATVTQAGDQSAASSLDNLNVLIEGERVFFFFFLI